MAGLVPAIHVFRNLMLIKNVDARDKPGHDGESFQIRFMLTETFGPFLMVW
jgi:hypothetical protein